MTDFFDDHVDVDNHVHDLDPHTVDPNAHHHVPVPEVVDTDHDGNVDYRAVNHDTGHTIPNYGN